MRHSVFTPGHSITLRDYRKPIRKRHSKHVGPYRWPVGDSASRPNSRGFYANMGKHLACDAHGSAFDLRLAYANDAIPTYSKLRHTSGYFIDDYEDETYTPIVARLPKGRGFLAGWTMGAGMIATLETDTIYETVEDAAYRAHSLAERDAEAEREASRIAQAEEEEEECEAAEVEARQSVCLPLPA